MKREEEKKKASRQKPAAPARRLFRRKPAEASGGASLKGRQVTISGDVVGRDKVVAGEDVVIVRKGGININLPRGVQIAVGLAAATIVIAAIVVITRPQPTPSVICAIDDRSGQLVDCQIVSGAVQVIRTNETSESPVGEQALQVTRGTTLEHAVAVPANQPQLTALYQSPDGRARGTLNILVDDKPVFSDPRPAERADKPIAAGAPDWLVAQADLSAFAGETVTVRVEYAPEATPGGGVLRAPSLQGDDVLWIDNVAIVSREVLPTIVAPTATASATPTRTPAPTLTSTPTRAPTETRLPPAIPTDTPPPTHTSTRARTRTPTATWTLSPTPTPAATIDFSADRTAITAGECVTLRWAVENVREVYLYGGEFGSLPGVGVAGRDSRRTCPPVTTTYTLLIIKRDGSEVNRTVTISVTAAPTPTSTATPTPAPPPPVVNGSFEQPAVPSGSTMWFSSIPGWSLSFGPAIEVSNNVPAYGLTAADGAQLVELDSHAPSGIFQDLPTAPGARYTLIFTFGARPGYGPDDNALEVRWDGSPLVTLTLDGTGASTPVWQDYSYIVTATGSTTRLEFRDVGTPSTQGTLLDNVRMASAP